MEDVKSFFADFDSGKVALEASYFWQPVYDELEEMGFEVKLAHPRKTRVIADEKIKTDVRASEALAQLLRMGWLPEAYVPPKDVRELRELLRRRVSLVESRTKYKNKIRAELAKRRIELEGTPWHGPWLKRLKDLEIVPVEDLFAVGGEPEAPESMKTRKWKRDAVLGGIQKQDFSRVRRWIKLRKMEMDI